MNQSQLDKAIAEGWVRGNPHPRLPLTIYNYSPKVQYEGYWTPITRACRGLVIEDETGRIVARPWPKFFNLGEHESRGETIPDLPWEVTDKIDGSLGIAFWYGDRWHMATRGSFMSDQAMVGTGLMQLLNMEKAPKDSTLLFEIIYPENRIVVDYGDETHLVLIGATTGDIDWDHAPVAELALQLGCPFTELVMAGRMTFNPANLVNRENKEGYVVRFSNGYKVKIKHDEYVRLHAILTKVSTYTVWEFMRDRKPLTDILFAVPDEFHSWVSLIERRLRLDFVKVLSAAHVDVHKYERDTRRDTALAWKGGDMRTPPGIFFGLLDGKDVRSLIWDQIKPKYERPFESCGLAA